MHSGPVAGYCAPALLSRNFPLRGQMVSRSRETTSEPVLKPESMGSRAETAGQRSRSLQGGGGTVATPAPLRLAVSAGAGGQGQALAPGPAPALPALALISWSGRLPESPARLLATPLSPAPLSIWASKCPGMECLGGERCPVQGAPGFPTDVQGGL